LVDVVDLRHLAHHAAADELLECMEIEVAVPRMPAPRRVTARDGSFTRGYPTRQVRIWAANFARGHGYGQQISPAGMPVTRFQ
jgi:hypothetical protein